MKGSRGFFSLGLFLLLSYIFAMFQGGFVSWFLFSSLTVITLSTWLWYMAWFKGLTVERHIAQRQVVAGDRVTVQLKLNNSWRIPYAYLVMKDEGAGSTLEEKGQTLITYPWFKKELTLTYQLPPLSRGVFHFQSIVLQTGDLFGFVQKEYRLKHGLELIVYPYTQEITEWRLRGARKQGRLRSKQHLSEDMLSVTGIRDYRVGDRLTHIHWKASARSIGLKTKEFEQQVSDELVFFLDREAQAYADKDSSVFELGVSLTASLVRYAVMQSISSSLISMNHPRPEVFSLANRSALLEQVFRHLAVVEADSQIPFTSFVLQQSKELPAGTIHVLVSPQLTEQAVSMLTELRYRQRKIEFFWLQGGLSGQQRKETEEERARLSILQHAGITYYRIEDKDFQQALSKGGRFLDDFHSWNVF